MWVAAAAVWDVRTRRIPNQLVVVGLFLGMALAGVEGNLSTSLLGAGVALGVGIVPFALHALGGGDVKAAIVVGLFVGPTGALKALLVTALLCGVYASIWWSIQRFRSFNQPSTLPVALPLAIAIWGLILMGTAG